MTMSTKDLVDEDFSRSTWISLLGLLNWAEFFISVDQTGLWRRHIAWAKPKGKDIKDYTTQRFSSNMVFLSLLLGANMNVLFNSAALSKEIRDAIKYEDYGLKYCIGVLLVLSAFVSVLGLVATFTAWGMISSISDCNAHSLLRSSMGQYVTSLPSRFVVGALYLFLSWLVLLVVDMVSGPFVVILLSVVAYLFFQVVVSLSAFGRLIIHTGAMGRKKVLDPEMERQLLPSGLHASLLIKATERCRRRTSVHTQYATPLARSDSPAESYGMSEHASTAIHQSDSGLAEKGVETRYASFSVEKPQHNFLDIEKASPRRFERKGRHRRFQSTDSAFSVDDLVKDINFPNASVLNQAGGSDDLMNVVQLALSREQEECCEEKIEDEIDITAPILSVEIPRERRLSSSLTDLNSSTRSLLLEWEDEEEVRDMYDIEPPEVPVLHELTKTAFQRRNSIGVVTPGDSSGPKQRRRASALASPLVAIEEDQTEVTCSSSSLCDSPDEESPLISKRMSSNEMAFGGSRPPALPRGRIT